MESVKWWQSDTIRAAIITFVASVVAALVAIGAIFGITIDPVMQGKLIAALMAVFACVGAGASVWTILGRLNTTTVIEGSKGEKAVTAATGVAPTPKTVV